ncbi:bifunctional 4-hydroxy-2-oxoglutarate aldolase/2-dehydro-3-deoxy-phosphogluconate aldolase [Cyanobium sp. FGCU-52]|nr:bifunctional 4-hydroxy-2-oxoglutarate aldolase/2-dehydro-3-deoxy-phosphogluconate aldolase [Cyanobium sp. FGCU52]
MARPLIASLSRQPLLVVLRPPTPDSCAPLLERLSAAGLLHVEIAWQPGEGWITGCRGLREAFPGLRLGAASIRTAEAVDAAAEAGFGYAVSPVADRSLLERAAQRDLALVPGVMSPSEVHAAMAWGCPIVKLFPAAPLGAAYWRRLREPLGGALPFCIAAGGLTAGDVDSWLEAGVDAVALGSGLFDAPGEEIDAPAASSLAAALAGLATRSSGQ